MRCKNWKLDNNTVSLCTTLCLLLPFYVSFRSSIYISYALHDNTTKSVGRGYYGRRAFAPHLSVLSGLVLLTQFLHICLRPSQGPPDIDYSRIKWSRKNVRKKDRAHKTPLTLPLHPGRDSHRTIPHELYLPRRFPQQRAHAPSGVRAHWWGPAPHRKRCYCHHSWTRPVAFLPSGLYSRWELIHRSEGRRACRDVRWGLQAHRR